MVQIMLFFTPNNQKCFVCFQRKPKRNQLIVCVKISFVTFSELKSIFFVKAKLLI